MEMIQKYSQYIPLFGAVLIIFVVFGTIQSAVAGVVRMNANWPQVQIAQDSVVKIDSGATPQSLIGSTVDISRSLAVFTNIYDRTGRPITGAGYIEGKIAQIPRSVLKPSDNLSYSAVTWQPKSSLRIAAVVVRAKNYYIVSGRSLAEADKSVEEVSRLTLAGAIFSLLTVYGVYWIGVNNRKLRKASPSDT